MLRGGAVDDRGVVSLREGDVDERRGSLVERGLCIEAFLSSLYYLFPLTVGHIQSVNSIYF